MGLVDFALQHRRFEAMMRLTPDEHREDLRVRRRRPRPPGPPPEARPGRSAGDAPELLAGATLAVVGASGLVVILAGGPPPRRVTIRSSANGATGRQMIRSADAANLARLDSPALADGPRPAPLARRPARTPGRAGLGLARRLNRTPGRHALAKREHEIASYVDSCSRFARACRPPGGSDRPSARSPAGSG